MSTSADIDDAVLFEERTQNYAEDEELLWETEFNLEEEEEMEQEEEEEVIGRMEGDTEDPAGLKQQIDNSGKLV